MSPDVERGQYILPELLAAYVGKRVHIEMRGGAKYDGVVAEIAGCDAGLMKCRHLLLTYPDPALNGGRWVLQSIHILRIEETA